VHDDRTVKAINDVLHTTAVRLREADADVRAIGPVRDVIHSLDDAYTAQESLRDLWVSAGRRTVGYKIGATDAAVRERMHMDEPDYGVLYDEITFVDGADVEHSRFVMPRIEPEIAFVLGRDLDRERHTVVDVMRGVDFALPAMEIADSRIKDWDLTAIDSVADNATAGGAVIGTIPISLEGLDLRVCNVTTTVDGRAVSRGRGDVALGNPLNALAWLADALVRRGQHLKAGDLVLTGALSASIEVHAGVTVCSTFDALGSVQITLS
jgi:2-keto-4-pentenoate hydratase